MKYCFVSLVMVTLGACGGGGQEYSDAGPTPDAILHAGVQMHDVTIVYPLASETSTAGYLAASDSGARGPLISSALYDAIGHISGTSGMPLPGGTGDAAYASLHVVAMRLDPCFAALDPDPSGAGCSNQLRLIMQQLTTDSDGNVTAFDSAMHLFYSLNRDELIDMVDQIAALRVASSGSADLGPLGPHPILVSQGLDGPMATQLRALILAHAGEANLTRVTHFSSSNTDFTWTFAGVDVQNASAQTFTPMVIPTLPPGSTSSQVFFLGFSQSSPDDNFDPATTSSDNMTALVNAAAANGLSAADRQTAFDGLVRIENPHMNSPNTIDCASCHLATPAALLVVAPNFSLVESTNANAFHPDPSLIPAADLAPFFTGASGPFNLHALSYNGQDLAINQRVANETAAIVTPAYLNSIATP